MEFHLPDEVSQNINAYMPKDKDMFSPTAAIVKEAIKDSEIEFLVEMLYAAIDHNIIQLSAHATDEGDFRISLNMTLITETLPSNCIAIH